jgi:hypothetical protein
MGVKVLYTGWHNNWTRGGIVASEFAMINISPKLSGRLGDRAAEMGITKGLLAELIVRQCSVSLNDIMGREAYAWGVEQKKVRGRAGVGKVTVAVRRTACEPLWGWARCLRMTATELFTIWAEKSLGELSYWLKARKLSELPIQCRTAARTSLKRIRGEEEEEE